MICSRTASSWLSLSSCVQGAERSAHQCPTGGARSILPFQLRPATLARSFSSFSPGSYRQVASLRHSSCAFYTHGSRSYAFVRLSRSSGRRPMHKIEEWWTAQVKINLSSYGTQSLYRPDKLLLSGQFVAVIIFYQSKE
jgi:hypothetical protein